jgi:hypothetical protein
VELICALHTATMLMIFMTNAGGHAVVTEIIDVYSPPLAGGRELPILE